jgi:hypothetical protein
VRSLTWLLLVSLAPQFAYADDPHRLVVTAAPPLDADRLADVLRTYLDGYDVEVRARQAPPSAGDLRQDLAATRSAADEARAFAAVRIATDGQTVEIQLVDALAKKSLVATLSRPRRDEDLYRTLALKVQLLLRSALYESAPTLATTAPTLARLVEPVPSPPPPPILRAPRLLLEVAYALVTFPLGGVVQNGVTVDGRFVRKRLEVALGVSALTSLTASRANVTAVIHTVPIVLSAGLHLRGRRLEGSLDGAAELLVVNVDASSSDQSVRSERTVEPALGLQAAGRVRLGSIVRVYLRASALGILTGDRYTANGVALVDLARLQVGAEAGLALAVW